MVNDHLGDARSNLVLSVVAYGDTRQENGKSRGGRGLWHAKGMMVVKVQERLALYIKSSLVLKIFSPRLYTGLPLSLMPSSRLCGWLLQPLLWSLLLMLLLMSCAVLLVVLFVRFLGLFCGACACSFIIRFVSPLSMLEMLASSCACWLFILASVSLDRLGSMATIDRDPHPPDGKL